MTPKTLDPAQFHLAIADASKAAAGLKLSPFALDALQPPLAQKNASLKSLSRGGVRHSLERKRVPMSKLSSPAEYEDDIVEGRKSSRLFSFLPYLLILALTLVGVGYTSISKSQLGVYSGSTRCDHGDLMHH